MNKNVENKVDNQDNVKEDRILFDWVSVTTHNINVHELIDMLGLSDVEFEHLDDAQRGYRYRFFWNDISISYDKKNSSNVWVEMSGKGCRAFERYSNLDWSVLFAYIIKYDWDLRRLDVAHDVFSRVLDIYKVVRQLKKSEYVSIFKARPCYESQKQIRVGQEMYVDERNVINSEKGKTAYIGSKSSSVFFRIYDKAAEQRTKKVDKNNPIPDHWVRFEIVLKKKRALAFIKNLVDNTIGNVFMGVVSHHLRFVVRNENDVNKSRWNTSPWWKKFIKNAEKIKLWSPSDEIHTLSKTEKFVYGQAGQSIATLINIHGVEGFIKKILENKSKYPNIKYKMLMNTYNGNPDTMLNFLEDRSVKYKQNKKLRKKQKLLKQNQILREQNRNLENWVQSYLRGSLATC